MDDIPIPTDVYSWQNVLSVGMVASAPIGTAPVTFEGYYQVVMEPGFQAIEGSDFTALIIPDCPTPPSPFVENSSNEETIQREKDFQKQNQVEDDIRVFPNPLQNETLFEYSLGKASLVNITIVDSQGNIVSRPLTNQYKEQGLYNLNYNANRLSDGVYTILLKTERSIKSQRMVVIRN